MYQQRGRSGIASCSALIFLFFFGGAPLALRASLATSWLTELASLVSGRAIAYMLCAARLHTGSIPSARACGPHFHTALPWAKLQKT
jgi:hypothetical protein